MLSVSSEVVSGSCSLAWLSLAQTVGRTGDDVPDRLTTVVSIAERVELVCDVDKK